MTAQQDGWPRSSEPAGPPPWPDVDGQPATSPPPPGNPYEQWQPPASGGPGFSQYPYSTQDPNVMLATGLRALGAARVLSWISIGAYVAIGIGGIITLAESENEFSTALYETGELLIGLGLLTWFVLGTALWACLAFWCSKTGAAARASGNARGSSSHMAWWGIFVPVGMFFVPFLAYKDAAKFVRARGRYGDVRNGGEGWKSLPTPGLLTVWWVLHVVALLFVSAYGSVDEAEEVAEGLTLTLAGSVGALAAALGGLAFGATIAEARRARDSTGW